MKRPGAVKAYLIDIEGVGKVGQCQHAATPMGTGCLPEPPRVITDEASRVET